MDKLDLMVLLITPLLMGLGAVFFSMIYSYFIGDIGIVLGGACFAFGMSMFTFILVLLFKDELDKLENNHKVLVEGLKWKL